MEREIKRNRERWYLESKEVRKLEREIEIYRDVER